MDRAQVVKLSDVYMCEGGQRDYVARDACAVAAPDRMSCLLPTSCLLPMSCFLPMSCLQLSQLQTKGMGEGVVSLMY